jgi:hypothetical protein
LLQSQLAGGALSIIQKNEIEKRLAAAPVISLIQAEDTDVAVATVEVLAASCRKHSISGDFNRVSAAEIEN